MKPKIENLKFVPMLFQENELLLGEVLEQDVKEVAKTDEETANMVRFYTECGCNEGNAYYDEIIVNGNYVERFLCHCGTWSMSVTY